jgi:OmpA-OmpF porin, OOP family
MFKKALSTTVLCVSVLGALAANAATPGIYVTGQVGYANTHLSGKTNVSDIVGPVGASIDPALLDKNLSNNGLAGRIAIGYQFNQNFAVEAGYLQLSQGKVNLGAIKDPYDPKLPAQGKLKLQQNAVDLVGKGILPITNNINVYGKLGVAYVTTNVKGTLQVPGFPTVNVDLNNRANIAKRKWAPEAAVGVSYDITPNVSLDTSWTHIQPLGNNKPGNIDFVAVGLGYNFG